MRLNTNEEARSDIEYIHDRLRRVQQNETKIKHPIFFMKVESLEFKTQPINHQQ